MSQIVDTSHMKELRSRLKELRKRSLITQEAPGNKAKIDPQTIWRLEDDNRQQKAVRTSTVQKLADALGVTAAVLTGQAPLPESGAETRRTGRPADEDYSINVPVDGAIRNAFTLTAMRYRAPIARIVEIAPFLFVLATEASLARWRQKVKEHQDRLGDVRWTRPVGQFGGVDKLGSDCR